MVNRFIENVIIESLLDPQLLEGFNGLIEGSSLNTYPSVTKTRYLVFYSPDYL